MNERRQSMPRAPGLPRSAHHSEKDDLCPLSVLTLQYRNLRSATIEARLPLLFLLATAKDAGQQYENLSSLCSRLRNTR